MANLFATAGSWFARAAPYVAKAGTAAKAAAPYVSTAVSAYQALKKPEKMSSAPLVSMPDEEAQLRAKRRALAQRQASGRASTIFTDDTDGLGG